MTFLHLVSQHSTLFREKPLVKTGEPDQRPQTQQECINFFKEVLVTWTHTANAGEMELQNDLVMAAEDLARYLRFDELREPVEAFFDTIRDAYPAAREPLRRSIAAHIKRYESELSAEGVEALKKLHCRFEDSSLGGRLRQFVWQISWEPEDEVDLIPLASELIRQPKVLAAEWPWLTSGEAGDAWRLGRAIAQLDENGDLEEYLPSLEPRGRDLRLLSGYVQKRREDHGDDWYNGWMTARLKKDAPDTQLLFEVGWRCGATVTTARLIADSLRRHHLDAPTVDRLASGGWGEEQLPFDSLAEMLHEMADRGFQATAAAILNYRLSKKPEELNRWDPLAIELATNADLIRSESPRSKRWSRVAGRMTSRHARRIAAAVLDVQAREFGKVDGWFAYLGAAATVLFECADADPNGVWEELVPHLESSTNVFMLGLGLPEGLMERLPTERMDMWIADDPDERVPAVARLIAIDFSSDETLASRLVGSYGDSAKVDSAFFSGYASGGQAGPISLHRTSLADRLVEVAYRTELPKLRRWASNAERSLRGMAQQPEP